MPGLGFRLDSGNKCGCIAGTDTFRARVTVFLDKGYSHPVLVVWKNLVEIRAFLLDSARYA